jgi:hypothetical protein
VDCPSKAEKRRSVELPTTLRDVQAAAVGRPIVISSMPRAATFEELVEDGDGRLAAFDGWRR